MSITYTLYNRNGNWRDNANAMAKDLPYFALGLSATAVITFFTTDETDAVFDYSASQYSFKFYADADYSHSTTPKVIVESGISCSSTTKAISIPLTFGQAVQTWLDGAESGTLIGELQVYDSTVSADYPTAIFQFDFGVYNRIKIVE